MATSDEEKELPSPLPVDGAEPELRPNPEPRLAWGVELIGAVSLGIDDVPLSSSDAENKNVLLWELSLAVESVLPPPLER